MSTSLQDKYSLFEDNDFDQPEDEKERDNDWDDYDYDYDYDSNEKEEAEKAGEVQEVQEEVQSSGRSDSVNGYLIMKARTNNNEDLDMPEDENALWTTRAKNQQSALNSMPQSPVSACIILSHCGL